MLKFWVFRAVLEIEFSVLINILLKFHENLAGKIAN